MKIKFAQGQVVYEAAWETPNFSLSSHGVEIAAKAFEIFSPKFGVTVADIAAVAGQKLSDWTISISETRVFGKSSPHNIH